MSRKDWQAHAEEIQWFMMTRREQADHLKLPCTICIRRLRTRRSNRAAREKHEVLLSLGLTRTPYGYE
jgi:hypothetical protein